MPSNQSFFKKNINSSIDVDQAHIPSAEILGGSNNLVKAANPILNLISQIRNTATLEEIEDFRKYLIEKVHEFEKTAKLLGVSNENIIGARYCLCTLLDESAAQTPWGGSGVWSRHSLLVIFHNETWGGEKFFKLLSKIAQSPREHRDLIELMYYCISLGLEGRFRIIDNGRAQLETLRQRVWLILRDLGTGSDNQISPHWEGVKGNRNIGWRIFPAWVVASISSLIGLIIYLLYSFYLSNNLYPISTKIANFEVRKPIFPVQQEIKPKIFSNFLVKEANDGLLTVTEDNNRSIVTLHGDGLFPSGSVKLYPNYYPILHRIADALIREPGNIMIIGHTDNVPIRSSRYESNLDLSNKRALQVSKILEERGVTPDRIKVEGRGESMPVADNNTAEGRAKNRRVEIIFIPTQKLDFPN